jgi:hypothetical protein
VELSAGNWQGVYGWLSGGWMGAEGHTAALHSKTTVSVVPLGAGLKYAFCEMKYAFLYVGAGAALTYVHTHNSSPYVCPHTHEWRWGVMARSGARLLLPLGMFSEVFFDYNYLPITSADVGGLLLGASFGWGF